MKKFYDKIISCFTLNFDMHLSYIDKNKLLNITKLFVIVLVNVTKKKTNHKLCNKFKTIDHFYFVAKTIEHLFIA